MGRMHRRAFFRVGVSIAVGGWLATACARGANTVELEAEPAPEPIPVIVRNENFLDVNVSIVASGATRRLGQVSGNSSAQFRINWNVTNGQTISVLAIPIGQNSRYRSPGFSVQPGQSIEIRLASSLNQSSTVVRN